MKNRKKIVLALSLIVLIIISLVILFLCLYFKDDNSSNENTSTTAACKLNQNYEEALNLNTIDAEGNPIYSNLIIDSIEALSHKNSFDGEIKVTGDEYSTLATFHEDSENSKIEYTYPGCNEGMESESNYDCNLDVVTETQIGDTIYKKLKNGQITTEKIIDDDIEKSNDISIYKLLSDNVLGFFSKETTEQYWVTSTILDSTSTHSNVDTYTFVFIQKPQCDTQENKIGLIPKVNADNLYVDIVYEIVVQLDPKTSSITYASFPDGAGRFYKVYISDFDKPQNIQVPK